VNLRKEAQGRDCMIRLPDVCNRDKATTVLAHFRMVGFSGIGLKAPDYMGAWACSSCHDACDRRDFMDLERDYVRLAHLEGVLRTQQQLVKEGKLPWGK
jgi:hypothetical protein